MRCISRNFILLEDEAVFDVLSCCAGGLFDDTSASACFAVGLSLVSLNSVDKALNGFDEGIV